MTAVDYVETMRRLKSWTGMGYRKLERIAEARGDVLPRSTMTSVLSRDALPREDLVAAFARACGCGKEEVELWIAVRRRIAATGDRSAQTHEPAAIPARLPPPPPVLVGRGRHLSGMDSSRPAVTAITGPAGIGKTALAVHWAHSIAGGFPDGQLYINLRGFDKATQPVEPADALRRFLDALGVAAARVPADVEAMAATFRSAVAGRRVLVVLDNVRDAGHARLLLPGSATCHTLVTSRDKLSSLVSIEGASAVPLGLLSDTEATELLDVRVGLARMHAEKEAAAEIVLECGGLPLALAVVAERIATNPTFPLAQIAARLRDSKLDALDGGDHVNDLRTVLSWSYRSLPGPQARLFRLLSLNRGPETGVFAAASLAGYPVRQTRRLLSDLARMNLITESTPGRFTAHDLLSAYAAELTEAEDSKVDQQAAMQRLLDHYLHTAHAAAILLQPQRDPITLNSPSKQIVIEHIPDADRAMAWFTREHHNLLHTIKPAVDYGFGALAWQLAWTLVTYLNRSGHWREWVATQLLASQAAASLGNQAARAYSHSGLGRAYTRLGRYTDADAHLGQAVAIYAGLNDAAGEAHAHTAIAFLQE